ncbi:hypothetical protein [Ruminococcus sp.]|nr:hypothetical protein [Ruminococcus sp.]
MNDSAAAVMAVGAAMVAAGTMVLPKTRVRDSRAASSFFVSY